ncbi:hypothetical protein TrVE_jg10861 [Triparma verrucosa]|uniref:Dynein light chain n=2 Tax=Triparma TaxID=722752 RepID=A0A9W6ZU01_9STRA|nr:hypothetical protein TrST_g9726 [Triparma strigata]GMH92938.1 hypothetical protein TrVE_jg10861 [Triparma verrucosa]
MSARPVVKSSTMTPEMQDAAIEVALEAIRSNNTEMEIAASIRKQFEQMFPSVWHCFVGRNFGSHVTHEATKHIYFYIGQTGVCLFATA